MSAKRFFLVLSLVVVLSTCIVFSQPDVSLIGKVKSLMAQKNLMYYVFPVKKGEFIGVEYLNNVALIVVNAKTSNDTYDYILTEIKSKKYRNAFQDLSMIKGNKTVTVFDFMFDGLVISDSSGDSITLNSKACYLNKSATENKFKNKNAYEQFVASYELKYEDWLKKIAKALK